MARSLVKNAKVYIFDEPLEGLDLTSLRKVVLLLETLSKDHFVIISTHNKDCFRQGYKEIVLG